MYYSLHKARGLIASAAVIGCLASPALAEEREFSFSATATGTSDYVFRGISQTDESPAAQLGLDATWGILYAGIWGSNVDSDFVGGSSAEIDFYGGIRPVWGPATFDLGVLYYVYPGSSARKAGLTGDENVFELKAGVSGDILPKLTATANLYWSPEGQFDSGEYFVYEGLLSYALPKFMIFEPRISGAVGHVDNQDFDSDYTYWNAGLALGVEKFTFDFRYWDSDISESDPVFGGIADERFVFTASITLP
jgi:uncharacterized protein (TIGR02001 family)